jgi:transforming growth factor-beta-induced protein
MADLGRRFTPQKWKSGRCLRRFARSGREKAVASCSNGNSKQTTMQPKKTKTTLPAFARLLAIASLVFLFSCQKNQELEAPLPEADNEPELVSTARSLEQTAAANAAAEGASLGYQQDEAEAGRRQQKTIVEIAVANPHFSSLVAAVVKTGLTDALANPQANLTVFAPTNNAFAQLPHPFNSASAINSIQDAGQIDFLRQVLLYHVLGVEVFSYQIKNGRSEAVTLKASSGVNDNTIYFSKTFGLIRINGRTDVISANINAKNGVIHAVNKVLLFPTASIASIAIADQQFSTLVAALVKTNLASVFAGEGNFTVFAPTNAAFAKLPAPFNNAANINNISNPSQIAALSNILRYHVAGSRYFNWDFGVLQRIPTLADGPQNKLTTILGYNIGWVKDNKQFLFQSTHPSDILATNGVIHVIGKVLMP